MNISVIVSSNHEISSFKNKFINYQIKTIAKNNFFTGQIKNNNITVVKCGRGKVSAALVTQIAIDYFKPEYIINTGYASALQENLKAGDIVIGKSFIEWDFDTTAIDDKLGSNELYQENNLNIKNTIEGLIVSGDRLISPNYILKHFPNALCADMESTAIAHVAAQNNISFCVLRYIGG